MQLIYFHLQHTQNRYDHVDFFYQKTFKNNILTWEDVKNVYSKFE